jgi:hypothetical protein
LEKDVKSRIVFETPETTDRQGITRNRSFSGYKLDSALLHHTMETRNMQQINDKHKKTERTSNLTV